MRSSEGHRVKAAEAESTPYRALSRLQRVPAFPARRGRPATAPFHGGPPRQAGEGQHSRGRTHLPGAGRGAVPAASGPHLGASRRARVSAGRRPAPSLPAVRSHGSRALGVFSPPPPPGPESRNHRGGPGCASGRRGPPRLEPAPGPGALLRPREKGCQSPWLSRGGAGRVEPRAREGSRRGGGVVTSRVSADPSPPASPRSRLYRY